MMRLRGPSPCAAAMEEVLAQFKAVASLLATIPKEMGAATDTASEAQKAVVVRLLNRMSFNLSLIHI